MAFIPNLPKQMVMVSCYGDLCHKKYPKYPNFKTQTPQKDLEKNALCALMLYMWQLPKHICNLFGNKNSLTLALILYSTYLVQTCGKPGASGLGKKGRIHSKLGIIPSQQHCRRNSQGFWHFHISTVCLQNFF